MFSQFKLRIKDFFSPPENGHQIDFSALKEMLGYDFQSERLFVQAFKHRSYLPVNQEQRIDSNERLELLGDAVLGLVVIDFLYKRYPRKEEGELTNMKSLIVSRRVLAKVSRALRLGEFFLLSESEERAGGRNRASINSDAFESVLGAIYLDGGLESARVFVEEKLLCNFEDIIQDELHTNFKSMLLEYAQSKNLGSPCYAVKTIDGPDHQRVFTIQVKLQDDVLGAGTAKSKKRAEQLAAQEALKGLYLI